MIPAGLPGGGPAFFIQNASVSSGVLRRPAFRVYVMFKARAILPSGKDDSLCVPVLFTDDRYERTQTLLERAGPDFSAQDAFAVLRAVSQEGPWATRVSFVYSAKEHTVYYVQNNRFDAVQSHRFAP